MEHVGMSIKILKMSDKVLSDCASERQSGKLELKKSSFYMNKKTLILDLDETLIHYVENEDANPDFKI